MTPRPMEIPRATARRIRLVVLDVDGVMTGGGVYVGATAAGTPVELKRFHVQDGLALRILQDSGMHVALLSGRVSGATLIRAAELGIQDVVPGWWCGQGPHPAGAAGFQGPPVG